MVADTVLVLCRTVGYVPDGMSAEQYKRMKEKEQKEKASKRFGAFGPQTFKSRSLQSFQNDLESGKAGHLMPMMNAKEKLRQGKIKQEDIPYMQRGGNWDNSDVKGAKKLKGNKYDQQYQQNARPIGVDWMGVNSRTGPAASNKGAAPEAPKKKGWFGW